MAQWNLSVQLTGQGSNLAATLRSSATQARHLSQEVRQARQEIDRLRAAGSRGIQIGVRLDTARLRSDLRSALAGAGGRSLTVTANVDAGRAALGLDRLRDAAREAGQELQNLRSSATGAAQAVSRLGTATNQAETRLGSLSTRSQALRGDLDSTTGSVTRLGNSLGGLRGNLGSLGNAGGSGGALGGRAGLWGLLGALGTAAIPALTALGPLTASIAAGFTAGATAAGAFGVAVAGQATQIAEAAEAATKFEEAVAEHGAASQEAAEASLAYQRTLARLPQETQEAAVAFDSLKESYREWSDSLAGTTMAPVTKSFTVLEQLLPKLTPHVQAASRELDELVTLAGGAVASPGFDALNDKFSDFTASTLDEMGDKLVHVLRVLSEGGYDNGALGTVLAYVEEHGPAAREALGNLADAAGNLLEGAAQAGPVMLTFVNAIASLVGAIPPEVIGAIVQVAAVMKIISLSAAGIAAVSTAVQALGVRLLALSTTAAIAGGGVRGLAAAFATLSKTMRASLILAGVLAVVAVVEKLSDIGKEAPPQVDKLTTSLGQLGRTGKLSGEAARVLGKDFDKLHDVIGKVADPSVAESINNWGRDITGGLLDGGEATEEFTEKMAGVDEALASLVSSGKADLAAAAIANMTKGMNPAELAEFNGRLSEYKAAVADAKFEAELAAQSMGIFGDAALRTQAKLDAQKSAADGLRASILALNDAHRSAYDAEIQFEESMDALTKSFKENGATLDISTKAGQENGRAMSTAAKAQDEFIASGLAAGESLDSMTRKSDKLREQMMRLATEAFDGNKNKATEYVNRLLGVPGEVKTLIKLERQEAIAGLEAVQDAIDRNPDKTTVTVETLNAAAIAALEAVGLKTRQLPDGRTEVFTANGQSIGSIAAVAAALNRLDGKTARTYTTHTTTFYENHIVTRSTGEARKRKPTAGHYAQGGVVDYYADGGIQRGGVRHFAAGAEKHVAQIAPAGSWRVWGEPETGGEAYIPLAQSKRGRSRAIAEETIRRLGGEPRAIQWFADGGGLDFSYQGSGQSLNKYTLSGLIGASNDKKGNFSLSIFTKKLKASNNALAAWRSDLATVARRAGQDVADALEAMGDDGIALTKKMAEGSSKYVKDMAAELTKLSDAAKASLGEYTSQLQDAVKDQTTFQKNLATLAGQGYGSLASRLAKQGDADAEALAAAAVKSKSKASAADKASQAADKALSDGELETLVAIIGAVKTKSTGIHAVAGTTGLGEDVIIEIANKARAQISSALGDRATKFLADLGRANKHLSYADGGIRAGMYATSGGIIRFAEPSTGGEAYLPLGASKRSTAMPVLRDVAARFGVGLTDAQSGRQVVIVRSGDTNTINIPVTRPGASAADIAAKVGREMRRARRGGVAARAA